MAKSKNLSPVSMLRALAITACVLATGVAHVIVWGVKWLVDRAFNGVETAHRWSLRNRPPVRERI